MKNRRFIPMIIYVAVLVLVFSWTTGLFGQKSATLSYSQVVDLFRAEQVKSFVVEDQTITMELYTPISGKSSVTTTLADPQSFRLEMNDLLKSQRESGVLQGYDFVPQKGFSASELIFPLLTVGVILLLLWAMFMLSLIHI